MQLKGAIQLNMIKIGLILQSSTFKQLQYHPAIVQHRMLTLMLSVKQPV